MTSERTTQGTNFTAFHAGPKEGWTQYGMTPPETPRPVKGKLFLRRLLNSAGLEISLNVLGPEQGIPFLHRHEENDEIYVVVGGRGQFLVNGECIDVEEGSVLRISPAAARAWRNHSAAPFSFLCIQYRADSVVQGGTLDGRLVEGKPEWPS